MPERWQHVSPQWESEDDEPNWLKVAWWEGVDLHEDDESESEAETQADKGTRSMGEYPRKSYLAAAQRLVEHMVESRELKNKGWDAWNTQIGKWTSPMLYDLLLSMSSVDTHQLHALLMAFTREVPADLLKDFFSQKDAGSQSVQIRKEELEYITKTLTMDGCSVYCWRRPEWNWVQVFKTPRKIENMPRAMCLQESFPE
eukprot:TRINITY_DN104348_c0_g1_i1.p1 TRINITY_DN104348_c0_g1~~TRINITY_DN104348_c0_g1_i1.p1  ORF type:complete len:200 (-),score=50.03 TRINITY_DN104348_c0_g1_i1:502-1101(-)